MAQIDLSTALDAFLPPHLRRLLRLTAHLAAAQGWRLYLVGGTVRDLLLGQTAGDLDLTVEGDALSLADALAAAIDGQVTHHAQFRTAVVHGRVALDSYESQGIPIDTQVMLDLVTARSERYAQPAVLPEVQPATLHADVLRRDFALNALAIGLNPDDDGRLYDLVDGLRDLELRQFRVLHPQSFVDDPTRILRGIRLAARLGGIFEPTTLALIADANRQALIAHTSVTRILHELLLIFDEAQPALVLEILAQMGVLTQIHPHLHWRPELHPWFAAANRLVLSDPERRMLGLALVLFAMDASIRPEFLASFPFDAPTMRVLHDVLYLAQAIPALSVTPLARSVIDHTLHARETVALLAAQIVAPTACSSHIQLYLHGLRQMKPFLDGDDLQAMGLRPGPQFRVLLAGLRAAMLDGEAITVDEQRAWVEQRARKL